jgi:aerobic-type carbon monoxide dehydrogenase small subunit (CoxS/CutS family)
MVKKGTEGTRATDAPKTRAVRGPERADRGGAERRRGGGTGRRRDDGRARITLHVNGEPHDVTFDDYKTLLEVLREDLGLTGTKHGCELGECGACAVLLEGQPVLSCLVLGVATDRCKVTTIEGVSQGPELHVIQAKMADLGGAQCGYCTPGIVLTAIHLLENNPDPTRGKIADALSGNLCRCTGYLQIFEAVEAAAKELRGTGEPGHRGTGAPQETNR